MKMYLPVGSLVSLKEGSKRLSIVGRCLIQPGSEQIYDYGAILYPEGMVDSSKIWLFNESDIERVWFIGFQDEEEFQFREFLHQKLDEKNKN